MRYFETQNSGSQIRSPIFAGRSELVYLSAAGRLSGVCLSAAGRLSGVCLICPVFLGVVRLFQSVVLVGLLWAILRGLFLD